MDSTITRVVVSHDFNPHQLFLEKDSEGRYYNVHSDSDETDNGTGRVKEEALPRLVTMNAEWEFINCQAQVTSLIQLKDRVSVLDAETCSLMQAIERILSELLPRGGIERRQKNLEYLLWQLDVLAAAPSYLTDPRVLLEITKVLKADPNLIHHIDSKTNKSVLQLMVEKTGAFHSRTRDDRLAFMQKIFTLYGPNPEEGMWTLLQDYRSSLRFLECVVPGVDQELFHRCFEEMKEPPESVVARLDEREFDLDRVTIEGKHLMRYFMEETLDEPLEKRVIEQCLNLLVLIKKLKQGVPPEHTRYFLCRALQEISHEGQLDELLDESRPNDRASLMRDLQRVDTVLRQIWAGKKVSHRFRCYGIILKEISNSMCTFS